MRKKKLIAKLLFIVILLVPSLVLFGEQPPRGGEQGRPGSAGTGTIIGELLDEQSGDPLMFASVVLHSVEDSVMITGAISNEDGSFIIENVAPGSYYLKIQFVGYPDQYINDIELSRGDPVYDTGVIRISPGAEYLSEVVVEAAREMMEVGLDRRVINVGQELTAAGGTALELMENIPSVNVDFEGNISLRGSSNVTILVDGRPSTLTGLDNEAVLQQIPSEMIERIEVITNPSVRYDPDGTAGIINIVTKKDERPGYNGMVNLSAGSSNRYSGSLNFNIRPNGNLNFFGSASGRLFSMDGWGNSYRTNWLSDTTYLDQEMDSERSMDTYNFQLGFDYYINDNNTITLSARYSNWERGGVHEQDYLFLDSHREQTNYFERIADNMMGRDGFDYSLNYRREFDQEFRELNIDLRYSNSDFIREEDMVQRHDEPGVYDLLENTYTDGDNYYVSFETDYAHPLNENSKLEAGFQTVFRGSDDDFRFYNFDHQDDNWFRNDSLSNHFIYDEYRYSAYGIFSTTLGKYSLQTGLRVEQAVIQGEQLATDDEPFTNDYFSFFPSAHLRRNFENNQNSQLSYSRRISRPRGWYLNPFTRYTDPYNLQSGNPELLPEYIHSLELSYSKYWENTTINPSVFYRHTEQMISRYRTMDERGITYTTWENIGHGINYGVELIASQTIADWWRVNGNFSYFRRIVDGGTHENEYTADSYSWTARLNNHISLGDNLSVQVSGNYRSPVVMLQGERKEMYSADMGLRYNILDNSGSITLRVSDIFDTRKFNMYMMGDNFEQTSERRRTSRMVFLGFTYRIHDYRNDRDRRDSDDVEPMDMNEGF